MQRDVTAARDTHIMQSQKPHKKEQAENNIQYDQSSAVQPALLTINITTVVLVVFIVKNKTKNI